MARSRLGEHALARNIFLRVTSKHPMRALALTILVLALPSVAHADQVRVKAADRAAINALLDQFIPAAVAQKNLQLVCDLSAEYALTVSHAEWMKGNTSVPNYTVKGNTFHGWIPTYASPGDVD